MTELKWHEVGEKRFENGVSNGVLYVRDDAGAYANGVAWNGLTEVAESPSGAEPNKQYADNIVYATLTSAEEYGGTINAFTYPKEFAACDGYVSPAPGIRIGQQGRATFGFSYQTLIGNDVNSRAGRKLHLVYGAQANPSEKTHATVNDSPEAETFSWEITTTPVQVPGYDPTASLEIDSTDVTPADWQEIIDILYGTAGSDPRLPMPEEILAILEGSTTTINTLAKPANTGNVITIPNTTGVDYKIDGVTKPAGPVTITKNVVLKAYPKVGYKFAPDVDTDWGYTFS